MRCVCTSAQRVCALVQASACSCCTGARRARRSLPCPAPAAAKCIKKEPLTKDDLEALAVEVKAMELLKDHPNFVQYYDFFSEK